jgi:hypothetical protein
VLLCRPPTTAGTTLPRHASPPWTAGLRRLHPDGCGRCRSSGEFSCERLSVPIAGRDAYLAGYGVRNAAPWHDPSLRQPTTHTRPNPDDSGPADALPLEPHPDLPVLGSLAGTWAWKVVQDCWEWSDEVYVIQGLPAPLKNGTIIRGFGAEVPDNLQVVPTTDLVFSHKHPDDLGKAKGVLAHALDTGEPFACQNRILAARGRERTVLAVGGAPIYEHGHITALSGFMTDLTHTRRQDLEPAIQSAINGVVASRAITSRPRAP